MVAKNRCFARKTAGSLRGYKKNIILQHEIYLFGELNRIGFMAMAISNVPVLTGKAAEVFVQKAEKAMRRRGTVDFSKQKAEMKVILANAKFK